MGTFNSKVAGVKHKGPEGTDRQTVIQKHCRPGIKLEAVPEPDNTHDENAIGLRLHNKGFFSDKKFHVGYLSTDISERLSGEMQNGKEISVVIKDITGGTAGKIFGLNITIKA